MIKTAHGVPVYVDTSEDDFVLTAEKLDAILTSEENVKYVLLNYPSNPTGTSYSEEELKALAEVIEKHEVYCVADEVYADLTYDGFNHLSIAKFIPEQTIVLNGLSKSFAMTGMRVGYMAIPENIYQTFYLFLKIPESQNQDDKAFALELAKHAKVGLIPGSAFGQGGAGYVRLSYAASLDHLKEAINRLNDYFK